MANDPNDKIVREWAERNGMEGFLIGDLRTALNDARSIPELAALQQAQQPSEQPPSIPEPSGEDVSASGAAYSVALSNYGTRLRGKSAHEVATLAALTTYTARLRERAGTAPQPATAGPTADDLVGRIDALLSLDAAGALVPHGLGGHARELLTAAANRLRAVALAREERK